MQVLTREYTYIVEPWSAYTLPCYFAKEPISNASSWKFWAPNTSRAPSPNGEAGSKAPNRPTDPPTPYGTY